MMWITLLNALSCPERVNPARRYLGDNYRVCDYYDEICDIATLDPICLSLAPLSIWIVIWI